MVCSDCKGVKLKAAQSDHEHKEALQDLEFVKSLWRQVQVDHKDLAAVVTIVMERETRKGEEKDLRVMEVLHDKDNVIRELNKEIAYYKESIELHKEDSEGLRQEWVEKEEGLMQDVNDLQEELALANIALSDPSRQKQGEVMMDALSAMDQGKLGLEKQLTELKRDLRSCSKQMARLKKKHEEQAEENKSLHNLLNSYTREGESFKLIIAELQEGLKEKNRMYTETQEALERVRRDAIEAVSALERSEELTLQKDEAVQGLRRELDERAGTDNGTIERMHGTITSLENRITQLVQDETKYREECLTLRDVECGECEGLHAQLAEEREEREKGGGVLESVKSVCEGYLSRALSLQDLPDAVDIIVSDVTCRREEVAHCTKLLQQMQTASKDKQAVLTKLQTVHDERLDRMNSLQEHLSEVLDELKCVDGDRRCPQQTPQPLKHEDNSTVWNDLAFYKQRSAALQRQLHHVQEDYSKLTLQRAIDQSALSDMKTALLEDQRLAQDKLRRVNHRTICGCNLQLDALREKVDALTQQTSDLNSENIHLLSTLHTVQARAASLEQCRCDVRDAGSQTGQVVLCQAATMTIQLMESIVDKENMKPEPLFSNTLNMLDRLTTASPLQHKQEKKAPEKKKTTFKVVKHHQGTQTMPGPVVKVKGQPAAKIRLASLNQQVAVLTKAKHSHARVLEQERCKVRAAEQSLSTALRQVTSCQGLISSLNEDVRVAQEDASGLREEISELQNSALRQSELLVLSERNSEIKKLHHQNKLLASQINLQTTSVEGLRKEVEEKGLHIITLEEKLLRADRSTKQLRSELESHKVNTTTARAEVRVLSDKVEDTAKRLRKVQDVSDNRKNYIETLKSQIEKVRLDQKQAVSNYEECKALLETKTRQLKDTEKRSVGAATAITNIETYATRQLEEQGREFSKVEKELSGKVKVLSKRTFQWEKCIKQVVNDIVTRIKKEKDKKLVSKTLSSEDYNRAKQLSSSILNLSEADFHDIMSSTRVSGGNNEASIWKAQLAKILDLEDFGPVLCNSLLQLMEEFVRVVTGEASPQSTQSSLSLVSEAELSSA